MSVKSKSSFVFLLLLVTVTFVLFLNFYFSESSNIKNVKIIKNENCLSAEHVCNIETNEFTLELALDKEISYLKPFNISTTIQIKNNTQINDVQLNFNMVGMNMGINRFILKAEDKATETQKWSGVGIIPICVSGRADWVADLDIFTNRNHYRISFPVEIKKNR